MIKNAFSFVLVLSGISLAGISVSSAASLAGDKGKVETAIGIQLTNSLDGVRLAKKAGKKSDDEDDDDKLLSEDKDD